MKSQKPKKLCCYVNRETERRGERGGEEEEEREREKDKGYQER